MISARELRCVLHSAADELEDTTEFWWRLAAVLPLVAIGVLWALSLADWPGPRYARLPELAIVLCSLTSALCLLTPLLRHSRRRRESAIKMARRAIASLESDKDPEDVVYVLPRAAYDGRSDAPEVFGQSWLSHESEPEIPTGYQADEWMTRPIKFRMVVRVADREK
jgi:hypothetical protein